MSSARHEYVQDMRAQQREGGKADAALDSYRQKATEQVHTVSVRDGPAVKKVPTARDGDGGGRTHVCVPQLLRPLTTRPRQDGALFSQAR